MATEFQGTDRFVIQRRLGAGGFGVVYEARDTQRESTVALKTLRFVTPESLYRFKREFRSLAGISHPNLAQLFELVSEGDEWFFTMELVNGRNFLEHVWDAPADVPRHFTAPRRQDAEPLTEPILMRTEFETRPGVADGDAVRALEDGATTPASIERLVPTLRQLVEGLDALHRSGNVHRDVKPSNVLVTCDERVVLLDFGLVMDVESEATLQSLQIAGTPAYMSPEQAAGLPLSPASDWYSVGVMLYQALTGNLPFGGSFLQIANEKQHSEPPPPSRSVAGIPEHLDALCRDLLRRDQETRPTAEEILARLREPEWQAPRKKTLRTRVRARSQSFVGREAELARLHRAYQAMLGGTASMALVYGLSGIGKSSVVRAFTERLRDDDHLPIVVSGRCYERESLPYKGVDHLIDGLARYLKRLPAHDVESVLPRDTPALAQLFPVLKQLEERLPARRRVPSIADGHELRRRAFAAFRELLSRLSDKHPLVLFIDDLQWGDTDSAALLESALAGPDGPLLLFIAAYRDDEAATSPFLRSFLAGQVRQTLAVTEIRVDRLPPEDARELALSLLENVAAEKEEMAAVIAAEAGGSPFFIDELVRSAAQADEIRELATQSIVDSDVRETTLAHMIGLRLARLPLDAQRLLHLVAVNGRPIPETVLKRAAGVELHESALALLRSEHLVRTRDTDDGSEVETYHDRIRETVVRNLREEEAREYHAVLADALQARRAADPELLAEHLASAGMTSKAAEYTVLAAQNSERALAFDRAARLYRRALDLIDAHSPERTPLLVRLGDALTNAGRGAEAASTYLSVSGLPAGEQLALRSKAAQQLLFSGHIDEGLAVLRDVLANVGIRMPETRRETLRALITGRIRARLRGVRYTERPDSAVPPGKLMTIDTCWSTATGLAVVDTMRGAVFQTKHLLLALEAGQPDRVHRALCMEAAFSAVSGTPTRRRTERLLKEAEALAEKLGTPYAQGLYLVCRGVAHYLVGEWKLGAHANLRAEEILRDQCTGVTWELDSTRFFALWSQFFLGEIKAIATRFPLLLKDAAERGDLYAMTMMRGFLSHYAYLKVDEPAAATENCRDAIAQWSQSGFHIQHMWELWATTDIALYEGRGALAWTKVQQTWPALKASLLLNVQFTNISMLDLRGRAALAAAQETVADRERLLALAVKSARQLERMKAGWADAMALAIRAGVQWTRGRADEAAALLRESASSLERLDMSLILAAVRRRLGEIAGGDEGAALIEASDTWFRGEEIINPARMCWMFLPWGPVAP